MTDAMTDRWLLYDSAGNELARTPADFAPSDISHATIWGFKARNAAGLTEAILVNRARGHRRALTIPYD